MITARFHRQVPTALALAACVLTAMAARADDYPNRPLQLVIPYAAGGGTDVVARIVADHLSASLGQRVVPDNKPGAGTAIAAAAVAKAAPNGYTLLFSTAAHALNATMNANLPFDSVNDFEFVGKVGQVGLLLMTNPKTLPAHDLRELVERMRKEPGKLQFGSAGIGTPMHLGGQLLKHVTKTDAIHVPYKGESAALTDLLGGQISFMLCSVTTCAPRALDGSLKALAVTSNSRTTLAPAVPTVAEAGFAGTEINTWFFVAAPKGTPAAVIEKLNGALNAMLADPKFKAKVEPMGIEVEKTTTPASVKALVQADIAKWKPIVAATGAKAD